MAKPEKTDYLEAAINLAKLFQSAILTQDDICQMIALKMLPKSGINAVGIWELNKDGSYFFTSTYGYAVDTRFSAHPSSTTGEETPVMKSITSDSIIFIENLEQMFREFPGTRIYEGLVEIRTPVISIPLNKLGLSIGALVIEGGNLNPTKELLQFLELVATVVVTKLKPNSTVEKEILLESKKVAHLLPLTNRELVIQSKMAQGKTNSEISEDLGYSESTIRQDAVSLFAKLQVKTRNEAGDLLNIA